MADQPTELRRINWEEAFPFTHLFRTFRMAIHPSKLGLALAAIVLTGLWGWVLDGVWSSGSQPIRGEIDAYWQVPDIDAWRDRTRQRQAAELEDYHLQITGKPREGIRNSFLADPADTVDETLDALKQRRAAGARADDERLYREVRSLRPRGVFESFAAYEVGMVRQAMHAALALNFAGGLDEALSARGNDVMVAAPYERIGVMGSLVLMIRAKQWMVVEHPLFALLFGVVSLAIWAFFGGAICRIAALNVARDERLSPKAAMSFAQRKFLGFLTAPLLPVAFVAVIGLFIFVGSLILWIPYFGDVIGSLGMILALVGGFVMALVIVGALAGGSLMWPTIAVEGSDGFDAISRSYNYVYSHPWRTGFYAVVSLIYGAICFLFARFFVLLVLKFTRFFVAAAVAGTSRPGTGIEGATKIDTLWPNPAFTSLRGDASPFGALYAENLGAWIIGLYILLITALLWSFLVSFYLSASTVIYYLLRREVDATDIEDVFVEDDDKDEAVYETAGASTTESVSATGVSSAPPDTSAPEPPIPLEPPPAIPPEPPPAPPAPPRE